MMVGIYKCRLCDKKIQHGFFSHAASAISHECPEAVLEVRGHPDGRGKGFKGYGECDLVATVVGPFGEHTDDPVPTAD